MASITLETGQTVEVDPGFANLSPEQKQAVVDDITAKINPKKPGPLMDFVGQFNRKLANTVGFIADITGKNPRLSAAETEYIKKNPVQIEMPDGTIIGMSFNGADAPDGPTLARQGLRNLGVIVAESPSDTIAGKAGGGTFDAVAMFAPLVKGLQVLAAGSSYPTVSAAAKTLLKQTNSLPGLFTEAAGGALYSGIEEALDDYIKDPTLRSVATLALTVGGLSVPQATKAALGGAMSVGERLPIAGPFVSGVRGVANSLRTMTDDQAWNMARNRLVEVQGGEENASKNLLAVDPTDPLKATPAQQTQDPGLLGLEDAARREDFTIDRELAERGEKTRDTGIQEFQDMAGDAVTDDARQFMAGRVSEFRNNVETRIDTAIRMGDEALNSKGPSQPRTTSSKNVVAGLEDAFTAARAEEDVAWRGVDRGVQSGTSNLARTVEGIGASVEAPLKSEIPDDIKGLIAEDGTFNLEGPQSVGYMLDLYSKLRQVARAAASGPAPRTRMARFAHQAADAILEDLGDIADDRVSSSIAEAREVSRVLHEKFDRGAVGRILQRAAEGGKSMAPEAALQKTVGRGNDQAVGDLVGQEGGILNANELLAEDIAEYYRSRFLDAVFPNEEFKRGPGLKWVQNNREALANLPHNLFNEFNAAIKSRASIEEYATRVRDRLSTAIDESPAAKFAAESHRKAASTIFSADDPVAAARSLAATARKDKTGKAIGGIRSALAEHVLGFSETTEAVSGTALKTFLDDRLTRRAVQEILEPEQFKRLLHIAKVMAATDSAYRSSTKHKVSHVFKEDANPILQFVVRVASAQVGRIAAGATGGGTVQTPGIFVSTSQRLLYNLTNAKARQLALMAITDGKVYREMMLNPRALNDATKTPAIRALLAAGAVAAETGDDDG